MRPKMELNLSTCIHIDNITNVQDAEHYGYSTGETIYAVGFLPLILCFGVVDNSAFIFVVSRVSRMHTTTNCYLINLAVADIVFLLTAVGEKLYRYTRSPIHGDDSPLGASGCLWIYLIMDATYFASLCFVSLVSIERYCAVCKPQSRYVISNGKSGLLTSMAWFVSAFLAAAMIPLTSKFQEICLLWPERERFVHFPDKWGLCTAVRPWLKAYGDGMQTIPFFITLAINTGMYVLIVRGLNHSMTRLKQHADGASTEMDSRMRDQITRMLIINGVVFFICLAPFEILSFITMVSSAGKRLFIHSDAFVSLSYCTRALSYVNSVVNPIIYTTMSQRYRNAFKQAFSCKTHAVPITGQSCTTKYIGSTTQEHIKITFDGSRL